MGERGCLSRLILSRRQACMPAACSRGWWSGVSAPKLANWSQTECHISTAKGFEPGSATLADSGKRTRFDIPNLAPGVRYYARLIHVDTDGRRSEPSREVSAVTPVYSHGGPRPGTT